ncbi:YdiU family protein [Fictibacillus iocasae]|uniref:Protein nucleotidyltransferase YdiU n=1 Tax=Fictibacillus iocasae TaxID=2715437 RepID=A0ABW2NSC0_9BACL
MKQNNHTAGWNLQNSYTSLPEAFFTKVRLNPVAAPKTIVVNEALSEELGLSVSHEELTDVFAGNVAPPGGEPLSQAYAGHQFGNFTMLGDGRAILLGEQVTPSGERFDIQLKGSGRTPYSRGGDGRAAVGPMLREFIISEAMHGLGIPTTRSLAVAATGEPVYRESALPGAVLTRVAATHLRVGTFEYASHVRGNLDELKALADYAIERHYPDVAGDYVGFLLEVVKRQASLIAKWQLAGFIHGVMNTDNMTISGETIDYGPCAFMDSYDPATVFSSIDVQGRYAYANQPRIGGWNLARFAEALLPLFSDDQEAGVKMAQDAVYQFSDLYEAEWLAGMRAKLGLFNEEKEDAALVAELLEVMKSEKADYTNTFVELTFGRVNSCSEAFGLWQEKWEARRARQNQSTEECEALMRRSNPAVIARNHRVEEALAAGVRGDYSVMERLVAVLRNPYAHSAEQAEYASPGDAPGGEPYRTFCGT